MHVAKVQQILTIEEFKQLKSKPKKKSNAGWREIQGIRFYFRSSWEANYARYLNFLKKCGQIKDWLYEPETFWFNGIKRGVCSYMPDFKVINLDNTHHWAEVKGYMDSRSKTKLKRFSKYYPQEKIVTINREWFVANKPKLKGLITQWE